MGASISTYTRRQKKRSDAIDRQLQEERRKYKRESKVLLLGLKDSGKSTILKQMKLFYQSGFSLAELEAYRPIVHSNVLDAARVVLLCIRELDMKFKHSGNQVLADRILDYQVSLVSATRGCSRKGSLHVDDGSMDGVNLEVGVETEAGLTTEDEADTEDNREDRKLDMWADDDETSISPDLLKTIYKVSQDPIFLEVVSRHSTDPNITDSVAYFFEHILRICSPGYIPNETDVLHARWKTLGISEERFPFGSGSYPIRMIHFDEQCLRNKKWYPYFDDAECIMFCIALSDYDQVLPEDESRTRLTESFELYGSIVNLRWFNRMTTILLLNKIDVFEAKLAKVPLDMYFNDYNGGADVDKAVEYIKGRFVQMRNKIGNRYWDIETTHIVTQATDTERLQSVLRAEVEPAILQRYLTPMVCL